MKKYENITIGADIELFLQHRQTKEIVSAEGYVQGTKDHPYCFDAKNLFFATSLDNVLAEFCIPPAHNKVEFYNNIRKSVWYINKTIPKDYCTVALPSAHLAEKYLQTEQARKFGCEPDYNAYTGYQNNRPFCEDLTLRSAGGHIHIGYKDATHYTPNTHEIKDLDRRAIIQALDLFVGVPSIILEPDNKRKELYGKAGSFRPKPYGVEYRTPSNFYLQNKTLTYWMYEAVQDAINWLNAGNAIDKAIGEYIQETINENNKHNARLLIEEHQLKAA